jgi:hypothetical protein
MGAQELRLRKSLNVRKSHGIQSSQIVMLFLLVGNPRAIRVETRVQRQEKNPVNPHVH